MPALPPTCDARSIPSDIQSLARELVERAMCISPDKTRGGGYPFILHAKTEYGPDTEQCSEIGPILDETKRGRYRAFAEEKARRVARYPDHQTSFESMNRDLEQYQGAIRCRDGRTFVGFSGRLSREDEAICLLLAMRLGWLTVDGAKNIADISGNTFFWRMLDAV